MAGLTLEFTPEALGLLREAVKSELRADLETQPGDVERATVKGLVEEIGRHQALLDAIGWDDKAGDRSELEVAGSSRITGDAEYLRRMIESAIDTASERIAELAGEYRRDRSVPLDLPRLRLVVDQLGSLVAARADLEPQEVTA